MKKEIMKKEISFRKCISLNLNTYDKLNELKKTKEESLGFKLSWDAFFNLMINDK